MWRFGGDRSKRVLRGGSWNNHRDNARCSVRNRNEPHDRNDNIGVRLSSTPRRVETRMRDQSLLILPG
jgi:formylglycine-generating enzyme required for sulfatase activity